MKTDWFLENPRQRTLALILNWKCVHLLTVFTVLTTQFCIVIVRSASCWMIISLVPLPEMTWPPFLYFICLKLCRIHLQIQNLHHKKLSGCLPSTKLKYLDQMVAWPILSLEESSQQLSAPLSILFSKSFHSSIQPDAWKQALVS